MRTVPVAVLVMVTLPWVKVAVQPWSQKVPMERRAVLRPGKSKKQS